MSRKEKRLYEVKDYIKRQGMGIWKTRNRLEDHSMADFMEADLKVSEEEATSLELEIRCVEAITTAHTETPIRRNRLSTS
jgi:hypothetical protein